MKGVINRVGGSGISIYSFAPLDNLGFFNFFTGRKGGASLAPYDSLNTSYDVGDESSSVSANLDKIQKITGCKRLHTLKQVHGDNVIMLDSPHPQGEQEGDAVIVAVGDVAVGVRTADCLPILLADPARMVAAAVHAGRRGTQLRITEKTVGMMAQKPGSNPADIRACLGPCIRSCCYRVDTATAARFHQCCGGSVNGRIDIVQANIDQLKQAGVRLNHVFDCGICTVCGGGDEFYSYRKDGRTTGRFISAISLGGFAGSLPLSLNWRDK